WILNEVKKSSVCIEKGVIDILQLRLECLQHRLEAIVVIFSPEINFPIAFFTFVLSPLGRNAPYCSDANYYKFTRPNTMQTLHARTQAQ
ncbi:hypothetical protein Q8G46_27880, partial [Klebsiella pneumoniae]